MLEESNDGRACARSLRHRVAERRKHLASRVGGPLFRALDDAFGAAWTIPTHPFLPPASFDWVPALEAKTPAIRGELDALLRDLDALPRFQDISPNQRRISPGDDWRTFFFRGFGHDSPVAALLCPETARAWASCSTSSGR